MNAKLKPIPVVLDQAETANVRSGDVQKMIDKPGIYLCGDSREPEYTVPVVSVDGMLYGMLIDKELHPDRFLDTLTISGPFLKD